MGAEAPKIIMERDRAAIDDCDTVMALLDDGTAWETGYAYAKGKPVVGIRIDFRNGGDTAHGCVNAMIEGSCLCIAKDFEEVVVSLRNIASEC